MTLSSASAFISSVSATSGRAGHLLARAVGRSRTALSNSAVLIGWPATFALPLLVSAGEAAVTLDAEDGTTER
jgi:hypothetical protein